MEYQEIRAKEQQRLLDYQDVFNSEKGQRVLKDLQNLFLFRLPSKSHAEAGNGVGLSYIAGQRELIINIMNWVSCDAQQRVDMLYPEKEDEPNVGQSESTVSPTEFFTGD